MSTPHRSVEDYAALAAEAERGGYEVIGSATVNPEYRKGRPNKGDSRPSVLISLRLNKTDSARLTDYLEQTHRERSEVLREALNRYLTDQGA